VRIAFASIVATLLVPVPVAAAQTGGVGGPPPDDPCPAVYPGDGADKARIARWMARGAAIRGLPGELPVMAAIAETGVANIPSPDRRYLGYFQMDVQFWNTGLYKGYPQNPVLQLRWFTDYAVLVRQRAIAEGDADFGADPEAWGRWVGVVENPGAPAVEHYARRLEEARALVGVHCLPTGFAPDRTPPRVRVRTAQRQRGAISLRVRCTGEPCMAGATAFDARGKRRGSARATAVARGEATMLTISPRASRSLRVQVTAVDEVGNAAVATRHVSFTR
jgi:hypothetical protein